MFVFIVIFLLNWFMSDFRDEPSYIRLSLSSEPEETADALVNGDPDLNMAVGALSNVRYVSI
jgi:hypothetical protein